jgi:hypothetical protein
MMQFNHNKWCEAMKPYGFDYVDGYYAANLRELFNDSLNVHNLDTLIFFVPDHGSYRSGKATLHDFRMKIMNRRRYVE